MKKPIIEFEIRQSVRLYPQGLTAAFLRLEIAELKLKRLICIAIAKKLSKYIDKC